MTKRKPDSLAGLLFPCEADGCHNIIVVTKSFHRFCQDRSCATARKRADSKLRYAAAERLPKSTAKTCAWDDCTAVFIITAAAKNTRQTYCDTHQAMAIEAVRVRYKKSDAAKAQRRARGLARFNLTTDDYDRMLRDQDGRCAVCRAPSPGKRYSVFSVDHDHSCCSGDESCGACVRGLLCDPCNRTLGMVNDRIEVLGAMITYLRR